MGDERVCDYRGFTVFYNHETDTYWSECGGNVASLTEALHIIDRFSECYVAD